MYDDVWMLVPVLFGQLTIIVVFYFGLKSFERKMIALIEAKMERSDALLFLTEQHTKLNEKYRETHLKMIRQVLAEQQQAAANISKQVDTVPKKTAELVAEEAVKVATEKLGTSDSHPGTSILPTPNKPL
jgi:ABC-type thiamine transport system ATPase subunit